MFRLLRVIVALGIMFGWASQATAQIAAQSPVIPPRSFAPKAGDIPGWIVARVNTSRRESNWRAWHDSHPPAQYIYRGSWAGLGRTIGWYERLLLHSGPADAVTTVLVSEFSDRDAAALAYAAITKSLPLGPFSAGSRAGEWQPSAGIGSGMQGCASRFGTFVDGNKSLDGPGATPFRDPRYPAPESRAGSTLFTPRPGGPRGPIEQVVRSRAPDASVVAGGDTRTQSSWAALVAATDADVVAIHDSARPFVPPSLFARCVEIDTTRLLERPHNLVLGPVILEKPLHLLPLRHRDQK